MSKPCSLRTILSYLAAISAALVLFTGNALSQSDLRQTAAQLQQEGRLADAENAWHAVLQKNPADAEAYANLGVLEAHQQHYKDAVVYYRKALTIKPAMPGVRMDLGLSLFKDGQFRAAIQTFQPLLKAEPKSPADALRLKTLIGLAYFGVGEYAAAVPYLKEATAADPQNLPFRLTLAQSCLWSKQYQCVLNVYHEIIALDPNSAEADMLAGEALDEMKDKAGAADQFRAAVKADPKLPNVHFGLGYLLLELAQLDNAIQQFQAELQNNPNHAEALTYLADCDMKLSHPEAARPLLEKAIAINPKIELAHLDLGILLSNSGKRDAALREMKIAERLDPSDKSVHWHLGQLYKSIGMTAQAKLEFDKTLNLQKAPDQPVLNQLHPAQQNNSSGQVDSNSTK